MKGKLTLTTIVALIVFVLGACSTEMPGERRNTSDGKGIEYTVIEIEGMTCIWVKLNRDQNYATAGLTCNWSEWKSK